MLDKIKAEISARYPTMKSQTLHDIARAIEDLVAMEFGKYFERGENLSRTNVSLEPPPGSTWAQPSVWSMWVRCGWEIEELRAKVTTLSVELEKQKSFATQRQKENEDLFRMLNDSEKELNETKSKAQALTNVDQTDPAFGVITFMERLTLVLADSARAMASLDEGEVNILQGGEKLIDLAHAVQELDDAISYERMPETGRATFDKMMEEPVNPPQQVEVSAEKLGALISAVDLLTQHVAGLASTQKQVLDRIYALEHPKN